MTFAPEAEVSIDGIETAEDIDSLKSMGTHLLATIQDICRCGHMTATCDCCSGCDGIGTRSTDTGREPCEGCKGTGYELCSAIPDQSCGHSGS